MAEEELLTAILATLASVTVKVNGVMGLLISAGVDPDRLLRSILLQCKPLGEFREQVEDAVQLQFATMRQEHDSTH